MKQFGFDVVDHMQVLMFFGLLLTLCVFISSLPQNKDGKIPLHMAAMHGRFTGSQILIQNGISNV